MIILGLHFGHDASISIVRDGEVLLCYERERHARVKKVMSLSPQDVSVCLEDAGISLDQIDYCSVTSTQLFDYVFLDRENLRLEVGSNNGTRLPCTMTDRLKVSDGEFRRMGSGWLEYVFRQDQHIFHQLLPNGKAILARPENIYPSYEHFIYTGIWDRVIGLPDIEKTDYSPFVERDEVSQGFHYPATVHLFGRAIPAVIFAHHFAHIAYAFYTSPFSEAALLSHDGGGGGGTYGCGLFAYGKANRLYPLTPHHLMVGEIYDYAGLSLGFHDTTMAGKLMGLSAYGKPRFFSYDFVGNWHDIRQRSAQDWIAHCERRAKDMGYDMSAFGDRDRVTEPVNADFAASTQKLMEETMLRATYSLRGAMDRSVGPMAQLCMTGGVALNCPANRRIQDESPYDELFVPPAVTDSGLSIGSALALYHNILGGERKVSRKDPAASAYLGLRISSHPDTIKAALERHRTSVKVEKPGSAARAAANDLQENRIVAWFEGRSEIGPRALGHRSILANPTHHANWERVNRIKSRELWRPLAPAVLEEDAETFFDQVGPPSRFMLLNAQARRADMPAVTHVDGSARVQTVTPQCGGLYEVLQVFKRIAGIPVVMNTSLNGPGEPIIETPDEAIQFLVKTGIDALYMGGCRITRRPS